MAYATQDDLVPLRLTDAELVQLTQDDKTQSDANWDVVTGALEEASGKIDSYCRARYATPLQASDSLKGLTLDITVYLLFSRRRNAKLSETIRQRYEDAIAFLKDISTFKASLDQPATAATPQSSVSSVEKSQQHRKFDEHKIKGFI